MGEVNVLIVDDNAVDVRLIQRILKRSEHRCTISVATNGIEALKLYEQHSHSQKNNKIGWPPELVLLDINMPVMNGFEFLQALEQLDLSGINQQIYILSSSKAKVDKDRSASTTLVSGYLVKPVRKEDLDALLNAI